MARILKRCAPFMVAIVADPERRELSARYVHLKDLLRHQLERANVSSIELLRGDIGRTLGLDTRSELSLSRDLVRTVPALEAYANGLRRFPSDSEREWMPAVIAAGAALTAVHLLTCDVDLPSC